jgi:hypothetical protein
MSSDVLIARESRCKNRHSLRNVQRVEQGFTSHEKAQDRGIFDRNYSPPGEYRFRYYLDGQRWENDWEAEEYRPNDFGSDDSIVKV